MPEDKPKQVIVDNDAVKANVEALKAKQADKPAANPQAKSSDKPEGK